MRIAAAHGGSPAELAALLRLGRRLAPAAGNSPPSPGCSTPPARTHVLLVLHPVLGWSCPGGHIEVGEAPAATAARELREETGLSLDPVSPDPVTLSRDAMPADDPGPAHVHWGLGYLFAGDPTAPATVKGDRPAAWFPIGALPAAPHPPTWTPLLARFVGPRTSVPAGSRMIDPRLA